jgi:hypothetical protein
VNAVVSLLREVGPQAIQTQGGGFSRHLFFGCSVRESAVAQVRAQVARIAAEAFSADGDSRDYPTGLFRVEYESEAAPAELWQISGGVLRVEKGG